MLLSVIQLIPMLYWVCFTAAGRCTPGQGVAQKLAVCSYSHSHLQSVSRVNISSDCQVLDLSHNNLTSAENSAFIHLSRLLYLDLSYNLIGQLQAQAFLGLRQLRCLDLSYNLLNLTYEAYPKPVFRPLKQLTLLDVGGNVRPSNRDILEYPDIAFQVLVSLEELHLDFFTGVHFGSGFSHLTNLRVLAGSSGFSKVSSLHRDIFRSFENVTIVSLNLNRCGVQYIDPMSFWPLRYLKEINLALNRGLGLCAAMKSLSGLKGGNLSDINLSGVNSDGSSLADQSVTVDMFQHLKKFCLRSLDLSDNLIVHFDHLALNQIQHPRRLEVLRFNDMYLPRFFGYALYFGLTHFQNLRVLEFASSVITFHNYNAGLIPSFITPSYFNVTSVKGFTVSFPPRMEILNLSSSDLACSPDYTEFIVVGGKSLQILDTSYSRAGLCFNRRILGLENLRFLQISGNNFEGGIFLSSFPNLTELHVRDSPLAEVFQTNQTMFGDLKRLQHLDIANSGLTSLPTGLLLSQVDLRTLDVSYNKLTAIPNLIYSLSSLVTLDMRYNALTHISAHHRLALDLFVRKHGQLNLWLAGNPIACNCQTYGFVEWTWTSGVTFDNHGNYSCVLNNGQYVPLLSLKSSIRDRKVGCVSSFWVTFGAFSSSIVLLTLFLSVIVYRYRVPIKYWCLTLRQRGANEQQQRHRYDAFLAFCQADHEWVYHILYPQLVDPRHGHGYKLCVYDRDFVPGVPIEENIIAAIHSSSKIIMVITPAFVQSVWCRFELQMARMKMVQEGKEDIVIPIVLQDVPVSAMPKSLLNLWNTSVFLMWSDSPGEQRHFWTNLTVALGPVCVGENGETETERELLMP